MMKISTKSTKLSKTMHEHHEETRYKPMHDKGGKGVCKRWQCAMHDQSNENAHVGQGVLNIQLINQTYS